MNLQRTIENIFQVDKNTSATIIITIIVFILGYILTTLGKGFINVNIRRDNRRIFILNLETLIKSLKQRREVLTEQLEYLNIETFTSIPVARIQFFQPEIFKGIGHKDSFESFFKGYENIFRCKKNKRIRNKAFVKVWENMANIEFWENNMYEQMIPAQNEINRLNELTGNPLREMRILYTELLQRLSNTELLREEREFLLQLQAIINTWSNKENRDHGHVVNTYLSNEINNLCNRYSSIEIARKLRNHAMDASYWYNNIVIILTGLKNALIIYEHSLRYFSRSTKKIIIILKS